MTLMSEIQRNALVGVGIATLLVAGGYVYLQKTSTGAPTGDTGVPTTTVNGVSGTGGYTVEPVGTTPPLLKAISITASLPEDAKVTLRSMIEEQYAILRKEPTRVDIWLQLGVNRKIGGDFEGAIEAWEYVAQVAPKEVSATAHGNLGDLYMYFIKDYAKADTRFTQAVTLNPKVIDYYRALFYLYRDIYKDKSKAQAILTLGLKNNPGNADLLLLQKELT
ncbi:MAG: hypothetical protein G01um101456_441 [Parcubacteria group bacterium Gr01-1014_56]|nr:MAG: hypothetical protein G01um101456_441 [Parcubacteria group bacterium Gr01-1014_56]